MLPTVRLPSSRAGWVVAGAFALGILLRCWLVAGYRPTFLGIPDAGTYIDAARRNLFLDPVHPAGYAAFLRLLHWLDARLLLVTIVQHTIGVATAALLFATAPREMNPLLRLVPAVVVLFNGLQLWTEHTPLSDPLFAFLVALVLWLAVAPDPPRARRVLALGAVMAAAILVRTVGLVLLPIVGLWLTSRTSGPLRRRLFVAAGPLLVAALLAGGYVAMQEHRSGVAGFTAADGRITYAVAARFADCRDFTPPAGTAALCQRLPPAHRGSFNQYLWGFPDGAAQLPPGGRAEVSPAWRLFGSMPGGNDRLAAFGREAILHQPGAFVSQVIRNFSYYWDGSPGTFIRAAVHRDHFVVQNARAYYRDGRHVSGWGQGALRGYADHIELAGILLIVLLCGSLLPAIAQPAELRAVGLICALTGWSLLGGAALITVDPRYVLPALGPLALAAAIGIPAAGARIVDFARGLAGLRR